MFLRTVLFTALCAASLPAVPVQWTISSGGNNHWYDYVPAVSIFDPTHFDTARSNALASTHLGLPGYLATVTSAAEQEFINSSFSFLLGFGASGSAFLGASDTASEGDFRWLDGPEAGQTLNYNNWYPGYPSGSGNYLALSMSYADPFHPSFGWIDSGSTAFGYVIEYSGTADAGVPEPSTLLLMLAPLVAFACKRASAARP
ncbi:MAG: hypothetical protein JST93_07735 [Acidobacteria bacterium]|nr:hypothetical protein [Acidobacteriota bacterium]